MLCQEGVVDVWRCAVRFQLKAWNNVLLPGKGGSSIPIWQHKQDLLGIQHQGPEGLQNHSCC